MNTDLRNDGIDSQEELVNEEDLPLRLETENLAL